MTDTPASHTHKRSEADITAATEAFFAEMVSGLRDPAAQENMKMMNVTMRQIRPYEAALIPDRASELDALQAAWDQRDTATLKALLKAYFLRRQALVPQIMHLIKTPN
jgi:hypothetical protein